MLFEENISILENLVLAVICILEMMVGIATVEVIYMTFMGGVKSSIESGQVAILNHKR